MPKQLPIHYILEATIRDARDGKTIHVMNASFPTRESAFRVFDKLKNAVKSAISFINKYPDAYLIGGDEEITSDSERDESDDELFDEEEWLNNA